MSRNKLQKVLDIKFIIAVIIIILLCAVLVYTRKEAKSNYVSDEKITEIGFENIGELATQSVTTTTVRVETKDLKLFNVSIPLTQSKYIYTSNTTKISAVLLSNSATSLLPITVCKCFIIFHFCTIKSQFWFL